MLTVNDIVSKITNGSVKVIIWNYETGEVIFRTIWYNEIKEEILNKEVVKIGVTEYELKLGVID